MDILPLYIFPEGSLAGSVTTTVWIGVFIVVFFNLRFGWVLSGLVVPGYLVPLLITKPWSATVIVVESVVTYLIVYAFSERWSRYGGWSSLFGRDRFFALVLVGVLVRITFDGWLLPGIAATLETAGYTDFDYRSNLQSFGLVIIALTANLFWKTGVRRGMLSFLTILLLTYLVVRYGLMVLTNFSISNVGYMYEDLATSILASPKAYIVLLTTAFVASRMNVLYGWDFSGILLPSLLALQWYTPSKVLMSVVEALLILIIARWVLSTRLFNDVNVEGGRKLLLFFNIAFFYKMALAYALGWLAPDVKVSDYFAFGYLLSTLIAVKMHDKEIAARLTRALLQTSITAAVLASFIGFAFTFMPSLSAAPPSAMDDKLSAEVRLDPREPTARIRSDKVLLYESRTTAERLLPPTPLDIDRFVQAITLLSEMRDTHDVRNINWASSLLTSVNFKLRILQDRYFYLYERQPVRGWGLYVIDTRNHDGLLIEGPTAAEERGSAEAATYLMQAMNARALALSGAPRTSDVTNVLVNAQTIFHAFHRVMARGNVLQVRRLNRELQRQVQLADRVTDDTTSLMSVRRRLPRNIDLAQLNDIVGRLEVGWEEPAFANRQRSESLRGFAELFLTQRSLLRIQTRSVIGGPNEVTKVSEQSIEGYLNEWLFGGKERLAIRGSNDYVSPTLDQMLFFDMEVVTPLLELSERYSEVEGFPEDGVAELLGIRALASVFNYQIIRYQHLDTGEEYLILSEAEDIANPRYWGIYIFRLGEAQEYIVQVPRPIFETGTYEYGVALFERVSARALMIAGAHPDANLDSSADVIQPTNKVSLFNLVSQSLVRHLSDRQRMILQIRAYGYRSDTALPAADLLVAFDDGVFSTNAVSGLRGQLLKTLKADQMEVQFVGGSTSTAGYEVGQIAQARYLDASSGADIAVLRLSPLSRVGYRQQSENRIHWAHFGALGIESVYGSLPDHVAELGFGSDTELDAELVETVRRYQDAADIVVIRELQRGWPGYRLQRFIDRDTQQGFLVLYETSGQIAALFNLVPRQPELTLHIAEGRLHRSTAEFVERGAGRLLPSPEPVS